MASPIIIFLLVGFLDMLSVALILPHINNHARDLGFNHIQIGLVGAMYSGSQMITSPIVGSLSDVRGRKPILLLCLVICSIAYVLLGITSSFLVFIALRIIIGTFKQVQVLTKALAPDYIEDLNLVAVLYGRLMSVSTLGLALGPVLSGHVMQAYPHSSFTILCLILAALFIINSGLINLLPEKSNKKKENPEKVLKSQTLLQLIVETPQQTLNKFQSVNWVNCWDILLFNFLMTLAMGLYYSNFDVYLMTQHDVLRANLGYIIAFQSIIGSLCNNAIVFINKIYINDTDYSRRMFHIFLVMALSLVGLAVASSVSMYVAVLVPKSISFSLARIVTLEVVVRRSGSTSRGTLVGALNSVKNTSDILMPVLCGFINHFLDVSYAFYAGALFATIGVVMSYTVKLRSIKNKVE